MRGIWLLSKIRVTKSGDDHDRPSSILCGTDAVRYASMAYLRITVKGRRNSRVPLSDPKPPVARHDPALVHRDVVEFDAFYFLRLDELQGLLPGDRVLVGRRLRANQPVNWMRHRYAVERASRRWRAVMIEERRDI